MVLCRYKTTFLKDLTKVYPNYRGRIETLVFEKVPASENAFAEFDIRKIKGYQDFYRIQAGLYRIGRRIQDGALIFYRVKSREEIYGIFPLKALHTGQQAGPTGLYSRHLGSVERYCRTISSASSGGIPRFEAIIGAYFTTACSPVRSGSVKAPSR